MLSELDEKRLRDGLAGLSEPIVVVVHPAANSPKANAKVAEVVRGFEVAAGGSLVVRPGDGSGQPALPAVSLRVGDRSNIHYLALPEGHEASPFVDAILGLAGKEQTVPEWAGRLKGLPRPAGILIFIAESCPHCPQAVRSAIQLALVSSRIQVTVVDAQYYEDLAGHYKVRSVPTTVIDGGYSFVGIKSAVELVDKILKRDDPGAQAELFDSLCEAGRFPEAASQLQSAGGLAAFLEAWKRSTTSSRVGLLLTVEQALESSRARLDSLVPNLIPILGVEDAALRGDTADLLGQIGHLDAAGPLKGLLDDPNPDVAEIAGESLDSIMERN